MTMPGSNTQKSLCRVGLLACPARAARLHGRPWITILCVIALTVLPIGGKLYVTGAGSALVEQGLAAAAPSGPAAAGFERVPGPSVRMRSNEAQATTAPWIEANAWRFQRGQKKANYDKLAAGSAVPAAA